MSKQEKTLDCTGFTNVMLAENSVLKDKLEYIKDLCSDTLQEPGELSRDILRQIIDICSNKTCNNCKWWEYEEIDKGMVCVNSDSDDCTCWTDANHTCKAWEEICREKLPITKLS